MDIKHAVCFDDVMLVPEFSKVESRKNVELYQYVQGRNFGFHLGIPLIGAPMDTVVGPTMAIKLHSMGGLGVLHRYNTIEQQCIDFSEVKEAGADAIVAISASKDCYNRFGALHSVGARIFCIDVAHGFHSMVEETIQNLRATKSEAYIIAGNVADWRAAKMLAEAGVDCIRTSVGGGSACTTRIMTGFGVPTLSAVMDIADYIRHSFPEVAIMADGGIRNSGDAVKAMVAGAHFVMCGAMLAGTDEAPGSISRDFFGNKTKKFRGMASFSAMKSLDPNKTATPEGVAKSIEYKGPVEPIVNSFIGGIQSGCSYAGVDDISNLYQAASFVRVSESGLRESHPHIQGK